MLEDPEIHITLVTLTPRLGTLAGTALTTFVATQTNSRQMLEVEPCTAIPKSCLSASTRAVNVPIPSLTPTSVLRLV